MTTPKVNNLDCIKIKQDAQEKLYERINMLTPEEEIAYFQQSIKASRFSEWWDSASSQGEIVEKRPHT